MKGGRLFGGAGSVKARVEGIHLEELINQASLKGIKVWDIERQGSAVVFSTDYFGLKQLRKEKELVLEIIGERGLLVWLRRVWSRKFWLAGFFCFCFLLYYLSGFIWAIEVQGTEKIDREELLDYVGEFGLYRWGKVRSLELNEIEQNLYLKFPDIAWVAVERSGTKVVIRLVEKQLNPIQRGAVIDIVAAYDGIIFEMMVLKGIAQVKPGMTVAKGDVLIAGYRDGEQVVNAAGSVKGKVFIEAYGEAAVEETEQSYTGDQRQVDILELWGKKIPLSRRPKYQHYEVEESSTAIFRNLIVWRRQTFSEISLRTNRFSPKEAEELALYRALVAAHAQLDPDAVIINKEVECLSQRSPFIYRVFITAETDIGSEMVQFRGD
ncbi:MAG TPA: sporulation protein YqfD [Bacillota bacterium]|nr:sporulation protein YqfD [Bacillota bacterium]HPZ21538.1 sporulation protein YqfD [Bacillota bacterium]HQD19595.1 sporulation protein YqfD [Bacillota bacterium]